MKAGKISTREMGKRVAEDKSLREKLFKGVCDHVSMGYSLDCYESLSVLSIEKYLKLYPEEFIEEDLEAAMRKGKQQWESIGRRQAEGQCLGNSRSWYYNMANRYKWSDKQEISADVKGQVSVSVISYADTKLTDKSEVD